MNDPLAMLNQPQSCQSPYIVIIVDMHACKVHDRYINAGVDGARLFATNLKQKLKEANGLLHPNIAIHVEVIADETAWETLFRTKKQFIDGLNGDNNCRISYHRDFNKTAEGNTLSSARASAISVDEN